MAKATAAATSTAPVSSWKENKSLLRQFRGFITKIATEGNLGTVKKVNWETSKVTLESGDKKKDRAFTITAKPDGNTFYLRFAGAMKAAYLVKPSAKPTKAPAALASKRR